MPDLHASPTPSKAATLLAQAGQTVRLAHALAESGRTVELAGLDQVVGVACAQALDLQPDEGRALRPQLMTLLCACDALRLALSHPRQKAEPCLPTHQRS